MSVQNNFSKNNKEDILKIKKFLSFVLRHKPFYYKVRLDSEGYADSQALMSLIEKHFDMSISKDEFIYITKDLSGGIFKLSNDGSKICARHGHSFIYNLNVPEGFEPCVELPRELYFNISSNDFMANMKSDAIPLSNKKIVLTKHVPQKINATVTCKLNSQNIDLKTVKFYYNKNDDTFFTLVVPKNLVAIHV